MRPAIAAPLVVAAALLAGCGRQPVQAPVQSRAASAQLPIPADYVLCIDNSRSITPREQVLVRETAMLLADLAASGDRLTVVTFGASARVAASVLIAGNTDRVAFKHELRQNLTFQENFSDIRMAIRLLASERSTLFRRSGSIRAPLLLSDGKLEPADRNTAAALAEIRERLQGPLADTNIDAVVFGNTTSRDVILPGMTGRLLMEREIARSSEFFHPADTLDQLLDIAVTVLNRTKGVNSLGENGKTRLKVDKSVESITFIVRKKSTDGSELLRSPDIRLERAEPQPGVVLTRASGAPSGVAESIYWSSDYEYFDLISVQAPGEGVWRVTSADGRPVTALSKVVTSIDLQFTARRSYYANESAGMAAWLYDRKAGAKSTRAYRLQARLARRGALAQSEEYAPLRFAPAAGEHTFDAPAELVARFGSATGEYEVELVAEDPQNPWFVRRSPAVAVRVAAPFIVWGIVPARFVRIPLWARPLGLGARMTTAAAPDFETPPRLEVTVERMGSEGFVPERGVVLPPGPGGRSVYLWDAAIPGSGQYRYRYRLVGTTRSEGPFEIESPWHGFQVRYPWGEAGLALLLLLAALSQATAKVRGRLTVQAPGAAVQVINVASKTYGSSRIPSLKRAALTFELRPVRILFVRSWIVLTTSGANVTLDRRPVRAGTKIRLRASGSHVLSSGQGSEGVTVKMSLTV